MIQEIWKLMIFLSKQKLKIRKKRLLKRTKNQIRLFEVRKQGFDRKNMYKIRKKIKLFV